MTVRVTVCELSNDPVELERDWEGLIAHIKSVSSDLVVLPEMPFAPWFAVARRFDADVWQAAVAAHDTWVERLVDLAPAAVVGSRPTNAAISLSRAACSRACPLTRCEAALPEPCDNAHAESASRSIGCRDRPR